MDTGAGGGLGPTGGEFGAEPPYGGPNLPNQTYRTKPSKLTKPSLWNLAYQTKPTEPNLSSQTFKKKY